jgi:hypothetical protein
MGCAFLHNLVYTTKSRLTDFNHDDITAPNMNPTFGMTMTMTTPSRLTRGVLVFGQS